MCLVSCQQTFCLWTLCQSGSEVLCLWLYLRVLAVLIPSHAHKSSSGAACSELLLPWVWPHTHTGRGCVLEHKQDLSDSTGKERGPSLKHFPHSSALSQALVLTNSNRSTLPQPPSSCLQYFALFSIPHPHSLYHAHSFCLFPFVYSTSAGSAVAPELTRNAS